MFHYDTICKATLSILKTVKRENQMPGVLISQRSLQLRPAEQLVMLWFGCNILKRCFLIDLYDLYIILQNDFKSYSDLKRKKLPQIRYIDLKINS